MAVWHKKLNPEERAEFKKAFQAYAHLPGALRTLALEIGLANETTLYHYRAGNTAPSSPRAAEIRAAIAKIMERGGPTVPPRGKYGRPGKKRGTNHMLTPAENDALRRRLAAVLKRHKLSIPKFAAKWGFPALSALYIFLNKEGGITSRTQEKLEKAFAELEAPSAGLAVAPRQRELPLEVSHPPREPAPTMRIRAVLEAGHHLNGASEPHPTSADELLRKWGEDAIRYVLSQTTKNQ